MPKKLKMKKKEEENKKCSSFAVPILLTASCFTFVVCIAADTHECTIRDKYPCFGDCVNMDGSYNCVCPHGTSGNPKKPHGCIKDTEKFSGNKIFQ